MDQPEKKFFKITREQDGMEAREFAAERLIRFLNTGKVSLPEGVKINKETLQSPDSIKDFILSLDYPAYSQLLIGINAMARNKSGRDAWEMDGEGVRMGDSNIFPDQIDKPALIEKSLEAAKAMAREGRSAQDISIQLAVSLTAIHPFMDGNGRTAKFLFTILNAGYDEQIIKDVLTSDGFSNSVNAAQFQGAAITLLDPAHELVNEKFDTWLEVSENRKKMAELIIDIIQNNNKPEYLALYGGSISPLSYFKENSKEGVDPDIYRRIFKKDD